jgi:single-stranded DNA-binding protein
MIRALVSGSLYGEPQIKVAKSGNNFTTAKLRADGKDGATVWCSLVAFGELGERLASLKANAALSVSGRTEVQAWLNKTGEPAAGLSLVVDDLAVLKAKPRPKESYPQAREQSYPQAQASGPRPFAPAGFDDSEGDD